MAANLLASVHFFLLLNVPIVVGACLIMLFLVDKRGHLGEKKISCRQHSNVRGVALCVVSLSKTHLSLF